MSESHPWFSSAAEPLSAAGEARRAQMLEALTSSVRQRRRRRTAARTGLAATVAAAVLVWWGLDRSAGSGASENRSPGGPREASAAIMAHADFARIPVDPARDAATRRRMAARSSGLVVRVGDDDLPGLLRAAGHPGGVIRIDGKARPIGKVPLVALGE